VYKSSTQPYAHQREALAIAKGRDAFAYLLEMGTGKTKIVVDEVGELSTEQPIGVLVVCPNGLQRNWLDEFRVHCGTPHEARQLRDTDELLESASPLIVCVVNIESTRQGTKGAADVARFVTHCERTGRPLYMAVDESHRIKNPGAAQTKAILALGTRAKWRRILTGTATANSPVDLFAQFAFLDPSILRTRSLVAFRAHYCELEPEALARRITKVMPPRPAPQIIKRDDLGRPRFRNLDELASLIAPHVYRKRKDECLDLPPKIYASRYCTLTPKQRQIYELVRREMLVEIELEGGSVRIDSPIMLVRLTKLAQIVGGFVEGERINEPQDNPKLNALLEIAEDADGSSLLVWARHLHEIDEVVAALKRAGRRVGVLTGAQSADERRGHIEAFQAGALCSLVGQVAMGIGFNATRAAHVIYYSNDFSLVNRMQSEDRAHRSGLAHPVTIYDLIAENTVDEKIVEALRAKKTLAQAVAGDPIDKWI
jgi:SNF2 family DNA or RNA helicase